MVRRVNITLIDGDSIHCRLLRRVMITPNADASIQEAEAAIWA
jgi:hypothetical protein